MPASLCTVLAVVMAAMLAAAVAPRVATADGSDEPAAELPPIVVISGPRTGLGESTLDSTGFSEVIDVRDAWRGDTTVAEVLEHSVGVQVRSFGGREDFSTLSIRGSPANQVRIFVDGVSASRASDAVTNLADLPLDMVERIELYRGFTPIAFAGSGAASVVNIVTRRAKKAEAGASVGYGSFDSAKLSLNASRPTENGTLSAFLTARTTEGDFRFVDDHGTPDNRCDDVETKRRNNDRVSYELLTRWVHGGHGDPKLTIQNRAFYKDEGVPGLGFNQSDAARFRELRDVLQMNWDSGKGLTLGVDVTYLHETVRDPKGAAAGGSGGGIGLPYEEARNRTTATRLTGSYERQLGDHHFVELSTEASVESFRGRTFAGGARNGSTNPKRHGVAVAAGDEIDVPGIDLTLSPQVRYELVSNERGDFEGAPGQEPPSSSFSDSVDPRLGLRWQPLPALAIKGNIGTFFRPPDFGELFGDNGFSVANPDLVPETGVNRDVGLLWSAEKLGPIQRPALEYSYFDNTTDNLIVYVQPGTPQFAKPLNVGKASVRGHEVRLAFALAHGLSAEANYTHEDAENRSPFPDFHGKKIPSLPDDEAYLRVGIDRGRWALDYELEYRGDVFLDQANVRHVGAYTTHSFSVVARPFSKKIEIHFDADNLTDERVSDVFGFPVPGRSFFVTVSYAWKAS